MFIGDLDGNRDSNPILFLGNSRAHLMAGLAAPVLPDTEGFLELSYDRIGGTNAGCCDPGRADANDQGEFPIQFTNNAFSLDLGVTYTFETKPEGIFGVFAGVGPTLLLNPTYEGFPPEEEDDRDRYREEGTRVVPTAKLGFVVQDYLRIGLRMTPSNLLDGYLGFRETSNSDFIAFISITPRINL